MQKFFSFIGKHAKAVVVCVFALTLFFLYQAIDLHLDADYYSVFSGVSGSVSYIGGRSDDFSPVSTRESEPFDEIVIETSMPIPSNIVATTLPPIVVQTEPDYTRTTDYLVLVESPNLFTVDFLNLLDYCILNIASTREAHDPFSVFSFVTLEKTGTRLRTVPISPHQIGTEWTEEEVEIFKRRLDNDPIINCFLTNKDGDGLFFNFAVSALSKDQIEDFSRRLDPLREAGATVNINGGSVINQKVFDYLLNDLIRLVSLCFVVIIIVYYLCFRSKRSVLIPLSLTLISLIWTFGTMKMLGIDINLLNIVAPCMVITLGSAYSIHILSEYYSKISSDVSAILAIKRVLKTVILACLTTVSGFLSLCLSKTEGLRQFGLSVAIGVVYCALLACIYLPAILSIVPIPKSHKIKKISEGIMAKTIRKISQIVVKYWGISIILIFVLVASFFLVKDKISIDSNYMSYFPKSDPFGQESRYFAQEMGGTTPYNIRVSAPNKKGFFLDSGNLSKVYEFEEALKESDDILQIISFSSYVSFANKVYSGNEGIPESSALLNLLSKLILVMKNQVGDSLGGIISEDGDSVVLTIQHWDAKNQNLMSNTSLARVKELIEDNLYLLPGNTEVLVYGDTIRTLNFSNRLIEDQNRSTISSILVVFIILCITFISIRFGIITIVPVLCGLMINYVFMYLAGIPFDMITVSFSSIAIGCGIDDSLHFMIRFRRKKLKQGNDLEKAVSDTINETGRPIILTTLSIVSGMMMLGFGSYTPIRYFGLLMSISLLGSTFATLFFLPGIILAIDSVWNKIKRKRMKDDGRFKKTDKSF